MCADKQDPSPIVLGAQHAAALRAEEARIAEGSIQSSPIGPNMRYDFYVGAMEEIAPHRLPLDNKLTEVCHRFAGSDAATRATMRTSATMDSFYTLLAFAKRSAVSM